MTDPADMAHCREAIRHGSLSFHAASRLLPGRVRDPALALYAFCRIADRAFAAVIEDYEMPRALPEALLEGLARAAFGRRYATLSDLYGYAARVAATVGAMMCVLMRVRDANALVRACDLGVVMQLTNIARDVGEDARAGHVYLPLDWIAAAGHDPDALCADPRPDAALRALVKRLLSDAERL